jgi:uncharacterized protein YndB with AHSA1/START domain
MAAADAPEVVEQTIELDADLAEVWRVLTDTDALDDWLGAAVDLEMRPGAVGRVLDPDGAVREVLVTEVDTPNRLTWHWWESGGALTTVQIVATPTPTGTRVHVVETLDPQADLPSVPRASARAGGKTASCVGASSDVAVAWAGRFGRLRVLAGRSLAIASVG